MEMMTPSQMTIFGCYGHKLQSHRFSIANFGLNARFVLHADVVVSHALNPKNFQMAWLEIQSAHEIMFYPGTLLAVKSEPLSQKRVLVHLSFGCVLHRLDNESHQRFFFNQSVTDMIDQLLGDHDIQVLCQWHKPKKVLPYVSQGGVSDYDFLSRLCSEHGIVFYYQRQQHGGVVLKFTDDLSTETKMYRFSFQPANGLVKDKKAITAVRHFSNVLPEKIRLRGAKLNTPEKMLLATTDNQTDLPGFGRLNVGQVYAFQSQGACDEMGRLMQQQLDWQRQWIVIETEALKLYPGDLIRLDGYPDPKLNRLYRILSINSRLDNTPNSATPCPFGSQITLIWAEHPYKMPNQYTRMRWSKATYGPPPEGWQRSFHTAGSGLQIAKIIKNSDGAVLDDEGRYLVQPFFYHPKHNKQLCVGYTAHQMQVSAGPAKRGAQGMHWVLPEATRVIVVDSAQFAHAPVILGVLPDRIQKNPVTCDNAAQMVMRHQGGSAFVFDDRVDLQRIQLHTKEHQHGILLEKSQKNTQVYLYSLGSLSFKSGQSMTLNSGQNCVFHQDQLACHSQETMTIAAEKKMSWRAKQDIHISCGNDWLLKSESQEIYIAARAQCFLQAKQYFFQASSLRLGSSYFEVFTANAWVVSAGGGIDLQTMGSTLQLSKQSIAFSAPSIKILAPQLLYPA